MLLKFCGTVAWNPAVPECVFRYIRRLHLKKAHHLVAALKSSQEIFGRDKNLELFLAAVQVTPFKGKQLTWGVTGRFGTAWDEFTRRLVMGGKYSSKVPNNKTVLQLCANSAAQSRANPWLT